MKNLMMAVLISGLVNAPAFAKSQAQYRQNAVNNSTNAAAIIYNQGTNEDKSDATVKDASSTNLNGTAASSTINPGAKKGKSSQKGGAAANAAMAAMLLAACLAPCPKCAMPLCAMSALAAAQAGHDKGAASESGNVAFQTNKAGAAVNEGYGDGTADFKETEKKALDKLKAEGYQLTANSLISPSGSSMPLSAFNSPSSMAAAGVDQQSIDQLKKITAEAEKKYGLYSSKEMSVAVSSGGGGGGGSGGSADSASSEDSTPAAFNPFAIGDAKKKALMDGKTVMFDGEPIGVAGSNIFETVHTAYQKRRHGNQFIETGAANPAGGRLPASVGGSK